ncbi:MAG TPA: DNA replication/repair protein RecF [Woeseiaceae bacterium]
MSLRTFQCTNFRCLAEVRLELGARFNLVHGANASGKTSLLEAVAYLGRGKSFRGAATDRLVRHGTREFVLFGRVQAGERESTLGLRNGYGGLEIHVDGERAAGIAELAERLPLQIVDPDVHALVAGGPEERRRYLDWVAFHVEHGFLEAWRRFRKALRQRSAALRSAGDAGTLAGWDREFVTAAMRVHAHRERTFERLAEVLERTAERLLGGGVGFRYRRGWPEDSTLEEALARSRERELETGISAVGPHRADVKLTYDERQARKLVSRGQQKLLACTLVLAATEVVQAELGRPLLLLLDDPAAELDRQALARLMAAVADLEAQVIATALGPSVDLFPAAPRTFHVEQGMITAAG